MSPARKKEIDFLKLKYYCVFNICLQKITAVPKVIPMSTKITFMKESFPAGSVNLNHNKTEF
jgi:hypothetical protein